MGLGAGGTVVPSPRGWHWSEGMRSVRRRGIGAALHGHGGCQAPCPRPPPWCPPSRALASGCEFWHGQDRFSSVLPTHAAAPAPPPVPARLLWDQLMGRQTLKA